HLRQAVHHGGARRRPGARRAAAGGNRAHRAAGGARCRRPARDAHPPAAGRRAGHDRTAAVRFLTCPPPTGTPRWAGVRPASQHHEPRPLKEKTLRTTPKPIQTRYAGCHFRSRLEARWAVFFDRLGIEWQYEPQGFVLPGGRHYLPDFLLVESGTWIEVKGHPSLVSEDFLMEASSALPD